MSRLRISSFPGSSSALGMEQMSSATAMVRGKVYGERYWDPRQSEAWFAGVGSSGRGRPRSRSPVGDSTAGSPNATHHRAVAGMDDSGRTVRMRVAPAPTVATPTANAVRNANAMAADREGTSNRRRERGEGRGRAPRLDAHAIPKQAVGLHVGGGIMPPTIPYADSRGGAQTLSYLSTVQ
jgi:hypothetical protein